MKYAEIKNVKPKFRLWTQFLKNPAGQHRHLLLRLILGCTTLIASTTTYFCYNYVRALLLNELKENVILEVQVEVSHIDRWLAVRKTELDAIASSPIVETMDWSKIDPYFRSELKRWENFDSLAILKLDGSSYVSDFKKVNYNLKNILPIQPAINQNIIVPDPLIMRWQGLPVIFIVRPIFNDTYPQQKLRAFHAGIISIDQFNELFSHGKYGRNSYGFAVNSAAIPILYSDSNKVLFLDKKYSDYSLALIEAKLEQILSQIGKKYQKINLVNVNGQLVYVVTERLSQANWSIYRVIPSENIESKLRPLDFMVLVIFTLLVGTILVLWQLQTAENEWLKKSKQAADAANQAKSIFLANMSHELRTPLNLILGFTQLLSRDASLQPEAKESLKIINQSGEHLLELIDEILSLAQIEAGRLQVNLLSFELNSFLDDIQTMFKLQTDTKNLWLRFEVDPNLPTPIKTDAKKLRQVLINLINNGIKFTEEGGVTVRVKFMGAEAQEKSDTADKNSQILRLQFEVEDTGVGIDSKELDKLFQAFMQTETGIKSKQGTGLGLAISREFVQLMGGEMTVQSQVGQGSLFQFYIQALPGQPSEVETLPRNRKVVAIAPGQRKYKILVVDDRWSNRQLLVKLLKPLGFEVQEAENGKVAVELWESWQPHLIWMDLRMPVMNGYEATQEIKSHLKGQATIIIALSANIFDEERAVILSAGCDDFVRKPFRENTILEKITEHLGVKYLYEKDSSLLPVTVASDLEEKPLLPSWDKFPEVYAGALQRMSPEWISQLQKFAQELDEEKTLNLINQIPAAQSDLAQAIAYCVHHFRYDIILMLTKVK